MKLRAAKLAPIQMQVEWLELGVNVASPISPCFGQLYFLYPSFWQNLSMDVGCDKNGCNKLQKLQHQFLPRSCLSFSVLLLDGSRQPGCMAAPRDISL